MSNGAVVMDTDELIIVITHIVIPGLIVISTIAVLLLFFFGNVNLALFGKNNRDTRLVSSDSATRMQEGRDGFLRLSNLVHTGKLDEEKAILFFKKEYSENPYFAPSIKGCTPPKNPEWNIVTLHRGMNFISKRRGIRRDMRNRIHAKLEKYFQSLLEKMSDSMCNAIWDRNMFVECGDEWFLDESNVHALESYFLLLNLYAGRGTARADLTDEEMSELHIVHKSYRDLYPFVKNYFDSQDRDVLMACLQDIRNNTRMSAEDTDTIKAMLVGAAVGAVVGSVIDN